jgi:hypothetical protein
MTKRKYQLVRFVNSKLELESYWSSFTSGYSHVNETVSQIDTMDFSSVPRALESIQRRQPPLPQSILDACQALSTFREPGNGHTTSILSVLLTFFGEGARWEALAVGLYVSTEILRPRNADDEKEGRISINSYQSCLDGPTLRSQLLPNDVLELCQVLHTACLRHLEHPEPRIRTLVIQAVSVYIKSIPEADDPTRMECWAQELQDLLWSRIQGLDHDKEPKEGTDNANAVPSGGAPFLETQWLCLASLIGALSHRFIELFPTIPGPLVHAVEAVMTSSSHANPHVRVAALQAMEQWIRASAAAEDTTESCSLLGPEFLLRSTMVRIVSSGLADASSQVRLAASVLCRTWFETLPHWKSSEEPSDMMSILLPPMCFNRFDSALGVKLYSQETWKLLFPTSNDKEDGTPSTGLLAVVQYLPFVCDYYVQHCHSEHPPTIRSAAGAAIGELIERVGQHPDYRSCLEPHGRSFWQVLMTNVQDAAWPVREAAGVALGSLCKTFPEMVSVEEWNTLWDLWTEQLTDPVGSEAAAVGLADLWESFGIEDDQIRALIDRQMPRLNAALEKSTRAPTNHTCGAPISQNDGHHGCPHCGKKVRFALNGMSFVL